MSFPKDEGSESHFDLESALSFAIHSQWRGLGFRAGMERADACLRLVVVRKGVLLPFTVAVVPVEAYVGMYRHSVVGQHALVNALPNGRRDRLRCCRIDEERSGLEYKHDAWAKISATAVLVRGRRSDNEHLATFKGELPKRVIGCSAGGRIGVVVMKELQNLPKAPDERVVIRN